MDPLNLRVKLANARQQHNDAHQQIQQAQAVQQQATNRAVLLEGVIATLEQLIAEQDGQGEDAGPPPPPDWSNDGAPTPGDLAPVA